MSRVGKYPVKVPSDVTAVLSGGTLVIKGRQGEIELTLSDLVTVSINEQYIEVAPRNASSLSRMMWGTVRARIANMVTGVSVGFHKTLEITGTGYRVALQNDVLVLNLGYSHDITYPIPSGIKISTPRPTALVVSGIDKQQVGQVAAEIRAYRDPEPYKGKGIRYDGEVILRKEGKKK